VGLRARSPISNKGISTVRPAIIPATSNASVPVLPFPGSTGVRSPQNQPQQTQVQFGIAPKRTVSSTVEEIKKIDVNREQRRRNAEELRRTRQEEAEQLGAQCGGKAPDIDFHRMIQNFRQQCQQPRTVEPIDPNAADGIVVCVRKRPIQQHELTNRELDCVTALNPSAIIHERKLKVDGITKCLESHQFEFDRVFNEDETQQRVYSTITAPLVPWVIEKGGRATLFAYGQTGSGKTFTMTGIQRQLAEHIFEEMSRDSASKLGVSVSFFEIYGGRPFDLLNNRQRLETLEDSKNEVQIAGLAERAVSNATEMMQYIDLGNSLRTTHATAINRDSSRSHAVCVVFLRGESSSVHGKWTLVDLAGSERAADSKSSIRQRRIEGAQINKSLLALKECIRAMGDPREAHIPFRASKLTLVLRDAFVSKCPSKTVMIACISPGMFSADHSVNTLRYSDRLKDHPRASRAREGEEGDVSRPRTGSVITTTTRSGRPRSPSPGGTGQVEPNRASLPTPLLEAPQKDILEGDYIDDEIEIDEEDESHQEDGPQIQAAWVEEAPKIEATQISRQFAARRGRQPTLRPRDALAPNRPDALGSRGNGPTVPQLAFSQVSNSSMSSTDRTTTQTSTGVLSPRGHRDRSPQQKTQQVTGPTGDLLQQDNRYLHNTLTSEVQERGGRSPTSTGIVDVGVEDLTDLAHMEALDEVRQWEDRIVSQHMVALQEDARLLTVESELLSQVQQGASYDIDWYVCEVEKVVRRKMEVYAGVLDELEVFKAQLRREETLSLSCQRKSSVTVPSTEGSHPSPRALARDGGLAESTPQRTPRTPRAMNTTVTAVGGVCGPS